ncbi:hypothetical protein PIB30_002710 [Stylosanthes scabra]|uniref:Subtilisin-like protease fibronectin type-III domain-containing protein n=1 Tax=Stylosanthes scabra TaxID=79078 RepID=A0ABU6R375_9FABA|nr:hypothetical protein [Stylosanthes scabra]
MKVDNDEEGAADGASDSEELSDFVTFNDQHSLHLATRNNNNTCDQKTLTSISDLNYPSIAVPNLKDSTWVTRIVTNVGKSSTIYKASMVSPPGVNVTVIPNRLVLSRLGQKIKFSVNLK